jgi:UDP-glucose 4-epimerase
MSAVDWISARARFIAIRSWPRPNLWAPMDCLVTGGAGFIGSNLVDALVARGDRVAVIDNLSTGRRENLSGALERGVKLDLVDLRDPPAVAAAIDEARPEVIFHLAAQIDVRHSVQQPIDDATANVLGTLAVLEAARDAGVRRVVNTSSGGAAYGEADVIPTPEDHPVKPMSPYGQSKYVAEGYCELYARIHGLSTISLRYSNVYGPRQDPHGEGGVVAIFCGCLVAGRRPTVFGDGRQTRDWVEVSDVVRANVLAAESELTGPVNIGRGEETSVLDLIAVLNEVSDDGRLAEPEFAPERQGEVRRSCLDVDRARGELGFEAGVELEDGVRKVLGSL